MTTPNEIEKQRLDTFAAAALTGLLASGKFVTHDPEDGLSLTREEDWIDDEGNERKFPKYFHPLSELAWHAAVIMIKDDPFQTPV